MPSKNTGRMERINEEYKREIGDIIEHKLKNPNVTGIISVTKVKVSSDLKYAKVFISIINSKSKKNTLLALKRSSGFIRSELARRINLRNTPEIVFMFDDSMEYGTRIDEILQQIMPKKDEGGKQ